MSNKGWIRLYRSICDNEIWTMAEFSEGQAFVDLLMMASYTEKTILIGKDVVQVHPGMIVTSESKLMKRWKWGKSRTRHLLKILENLNMIRKKTYHNRTEISLVNWGKFQDAKPQLIPRPNRSRTAAEPQPGYNQEYIKNNNNDKNGGGRGNEAAAAVPAADIENFIRLWNDVGHTAKISQIAEGSRRYENLCECVRLVGAEGITKAIVKVSQSGYLKRKGRIKFDSYINPGAIVKLLDGEYDEDYSVGGGAADGFEFGWNPDSENHD